METVFTTPWAVLGCIAVLLAAHLVIFVLFKREVRARSMGLTRRKSVRVGGLSLAGYQSALFILLSASYPLVSKTCLFLLHCAPPDRGGGYTVLVNGPSVESVRIVDAASNATSLDVEQLRCWEGAHRGPGVVAALVFVLYTIGYPLLSFIKVRAIAATLDKSIRRRQRWHHFVLADYEADRFWFRHITWAVSAQLSTGLCSSGLGDQPSAVRQVLLYMAASDEFIAPSIVRSVIAGIVLVGFAVLLCSIKPFSPDHRWKLPVRLVVVAVAFSTEILDAMLSLNDALKRDGKPPIDGSVFAVAILVFVCSLALLLAVRPRYTGYSRVPLRVPPRLPPPTAHGTP
jgi:hypothetical protein